MDSLTPVVMSSTICLLKIPEAGDAENEEEARSDSEPLTTWDHDRSLINLYIPVDLLQSWKYSDSGPGIDRILMLTTN